MKTGLIKYLTKYIWLIISSSLLYIPINFFMPIEMENMFKLSEYRGYFDFGIRIIIAILLYNDFSKEKLQYKYLGIFASLFYGTLGVIIFSLLFMENKKMEKDTE